MSAQSLNLLHEVIERSGSSADITPLVLTDPFQGFDEIPDLVSASEKALLGADEVICNATGGTTAMQYAIMRLSEGAFRLGRHVKWVAMVDNRPAEDQRKDPYVIGEIIDLER